MSAYDWQNRPYALIAIYRKERKKIIIKNKGFFSYKFFFIFIINLCFFLSFSSLAILPKHLKDLGASDTYVGFFMNSTGIMLILFVVSMKKLLQKIKRKHLLLAGFFLSLVVVFLMYFFYDNLIMLLILRFISGTAFALGFTLLFSFIYDILQPEKRRGGAAIYGISGLLASPIGSLLSEHVFKQLGPQYLFLLSAAFFTLTLFLMFFLKSDVPYQGIAKSRNLISILKERKIKKAVYFAMLLGGAYGVFVSFIPIASGSKIGEANISLFFIAYSVIAITIRLLIFNRVDKIPSKLLFFIAFSALSSAMFLLIFLNSFLMLFVIGFIYGIGHSILFPTLSARFVSRAKGKDQVVFNNIFLAYYIGGELFFPTVMGIGGDLVTTDAIFICMSIILFSGIIINMLKFKR
ncbi:MAG: MFS transporter [Spirochaetales bacterium]|nr:MFS transporter [Spirochaetales bacterium]